jgi:hypothetical protein
MSYTTKARNLSTSWQPSRLALAERNGNLSPPKLHAFNLVSLRNAEYVIIKTFRQIGQRLDCFNARQARTKTVLCSRTD